MADDAAACQRRAMAAAAQDEEQREGQDLKQNLSCLPPDCLALVLSCTTPADASRLASVCHSFAAAARSDITWENLLPSNYAEVCAKALLCKSNSCASFPENKRDVVEWLARGVYLGAGLLRYLLLPLSGSVCLMLSVAEMDVAWRHDERFWRWEESSTSYFPKVAHLLATNWLEIRGKWSCSLPPGVFSLVWRLKVSNPMGGRAHFLSWKQPLRFSAITSDGQHLCRELDLAQPQKSGYQEWFEFEVGQIRIIGARFQVKHFNLDFVVTEVDSSYWKGGLFLDCLTLKPSVCEDHIYKRAPHTNLRNMRGGPGVF